MLAPKRVKFRKMFKGRTTGLARRGATVAFGTFGLQALEPGWVTARQIEAVFLRYAPLAQERVAYREAQQDDVGVLVWEIHQLLDARRVDDAGVDALRNALYQALAEKAVVVQQMRQVEQHYLAREQQVAAGVIRVAVHGGLGRLGCVQPAPQAHVSAGKQQMHLDFVWQTVAHALQGAQRSDRVTAVNGQ